jgi:hypothetical protein
MATRYEPGIDAAGLDAIDMHVHLEVDSCGHGSLPDAFTEASAKYFKSEDRTPSLDRIADVYRELNMAAVVFTVDARTQLNHEPNSIPELIAGAARNNDVLIPFGSVDPRTGRTRSPGPSTRPLNSAPRVSSSTLRSRVSTPPTRPSTRCGRRCRNSVCRVSSTPARTAWAPGFRAGMGSSWRTPTRCCWMPLRLTFPGPADHHGPPFGAVAGRGELDRDAQVQRVHRPVRVVAEVLPRIVGSALQFSAAGQSPVRHGLPADHPAKVARAHSLTCR